MLFKRVLGSLMNLVLFQITLLISSYQTIHLIFNQFKNEQNICKQHW
jgi:hypothetical protein